MRVKMHNSNRVLISDISQPVLIINGKETNKQPNLYNSPTSFFRYDVVASLS